MSVVGQRSGTADLDDDVNGSKTYIMKLGWHAALDTIHDTIQAMAIVGRERLKTSSCSSYVAMCSGMRLLSP